MAGLTGLAELSRSEWAVLRLIRVKTWSTRADIAEALGVTKMHATNLVRALASAGLVVDAPSASGLRGQPIRRVHLKADAAHAFGVSFSHETVEVGTLDFQGVLRARRTLPLGEATLDQIAAVIEAETEAQGDALGFDRRRALGVGVALPGDFRIDRQVINTHYFPQFEGLNLKLELEKRLSHRVEVENDSTSAAMGEWLVGGGRGLSSFISIFIGHGMGGGIVANEALIRGHSGNAGIFGMPFPLNAPRPSGTDLLRHLQAAGQDVRDFDQLNEIDVSPALTAWLDRAADQLRDPLGALARAIDPEAILIGGRLPHRLLQGLTERLDTEAFCAANRHEIPVPKLLASRLAQTATVVGAAILLMEERSWTRATGA